MRAELITIGDELLYGHVLDTNAAYIGEKIAEAGVDLIYHTTVGDRSELMINAIAQAMNRADIVLTTGGLGPTHDDITKKIVCKYFKRQLVFHEDILKELEKKYSAQGINMPPINQNQALLPQGAKFLENRIGSALGIVIEEHGKTLVAMPGVPTEMRLMVDEQLIPMLKKKTPDQVIIHRKLRTIGIVESAIFEKVKSIVEDKSKIDIAFLPSFRGVDIRLTAKSDDEKKAREAIEVIETRFTEKLGKYIFGFDNDELPDLIGRLLVSRNQTVAVAESCTGGMLGKLFTDIPGSSDYFLGGVIAYSDELKTKILSVPAITIERHGAVSAETAKHMAEGARKLTGASIGISLTGIAGPDGGTEEKPVGLTYIGLATPDGVKAKDFHYGKQRKRNRQRAAFSALDMIRRYLKSIE
ncbi:MAG: competence/damage-inducible protein A [candidate division Zixibacteria bacterium]|nr:competence/damage-inducible protein A [candidate division Zixibacteria bacterium]